MEIPSLNQVDSQDVHSGISILDGIDWKLHPGKVYAMIGESGSGKTSFALSLFGITPDSANVCYEEFSLFGLDWKKWERTGWNQLRGKKIALIPQNPHLAFHPYRKMGVQVLEFFRYTKPTWAKPKKILDSWEEFGLRNPKTAYDSYPRSLSGGEKQRICISMAHLSGADLLVADEPTTALDPIQEKKTIEFLLKPIQEGRSLLLVTHDLRLMERIADEVLVVKSGKMVEKNLRGKDGIFEWRSEYANQLLKAVS